MTHWFSDLAAFRRDTLAFFEERAASSIAPLIKLHLGPQPVFLVNEPSLIKPLMKETEEKIDKGRLVKVLRGLVGNSFVAQAGQAHSARRAAIHHHLAKSAGQTLVPEFSALIRRHAALYAGAGTFEAREAMAPLAIRLVTTVLFGKGLLSNADENAIVEAVHLTEDILTKSLFRMVPPLPWTRWRERQALARGNRILQAVVDKVRAKATQGSLLQTLSALDLPDAVLRDEIMMLLIAGYHSTGNAAAWLLYMLGTQKEAADTVAEEADALAGNGGEFSALALPRAVKSLSFVKEVLRLCPSFPWTSRELKQDMVIAGQPLKCGTTLIVCLWQMHRDPRIWAAPQRFDTTRDFSLPAFLPFGVGARACIGAKIAMLELQLLCLEFASAFDIDVVSQVPAPAPRASITLIPPPIMIRLALRSGARAQGFAEEKQTEFA